MILLNVKVDRVDEYNQVWLTIECDGHTHKIELREDEPVDIPFPDVEPSMN